VGYFLGGLLLALYEFKGALYILSGSLFVVLCITWIMLPNELGKTKSKAKFSQVFSNSAPINWLSAARFFLFASRDVWFVVALPVYLTASLGWNYEQTGSFFALWVIGYGIIQGFTPALIRGHHPNGQTALLSALSLVLIPAGIALGLYLELSASQVIIIGLSIFAVVFAVNSAIHSYLIVEWADKDNVSMNVGFYYMANAGGRLTGTVLSGLVFQYYGLIGCLITSSILVGMAALLSKPLPR